MRRLWLFITISTLFWNNFCYQNDYRLRLENLKVEKTPGFSYVSLKNYYVNRTTKSFNLTFISKGVLGDGCKVSLSSYIWLTNQYRLSPIRFTKDCESLISYTYFDLDRLLLKCTKPPLVWPIKAHTKYNMVGWVPDSKKFPPYAPRGKYKMTVTLFNYTEEVAQVLIYLKIEDIIHY